jgi:aminopeptidase N
VGDTAFTRATQIYLSKNALQSAEAHNWRMAIEEATGQDWNWFFNQFYFHGDHPQLYLDYRYDDSLQQLIVTAKQTASDSNFRYRLPLKAALYCNEKEEVVDWTISKKKETFSFSYKNGVRPLFVPDYYYWLPGLIHENKKPKDWLEEMKVCNGYTNKRKCINGAYFVQDDSFSKEVFHLALKDEDEQVRYYATTLLERIPDKFQWHDDFKKELLNLGTNDKSNRIRAIAFEVIASWKIKTIDVLANWKTKGLKEELLQAMNEQSYAVKGAALSALYYADSLEAYKIAKSVLPAKDMDGLDDAAWRIVAQEGRVEDTAIYAQHLVGSWGGFRNSLLSSINLYLYYTKNLEGFEGILRMLQIFALNEQDATARYQIGRVVTDFSKYYGSSSHATSATVSQEIIDTKKRLSEDYKNKIIADEKEEENLKKYRK